MDNLQGEVKSLVDQLGLSSFNFSDNYVAESATRERNGQKQRGEGNVKDKRQPKEKVVKEHSAGKSKHVFFPDPEHKRSPRQSVGTPKHVHFSENVSVQKIPTEKNLSPADGEPVVRQGKNGKKKRKKRGEVTEPAAAQISDAGPQGQSKRKKRKVQKQGRAAVQVPEISSTGEEEELGPAEAEEADARPAAQQSYRWYTRSVTNSTDAPPVPEIQVSQLLKEANVLLSAAVRTFRQDGGGKPAGQWSWTETVLSSGTVSDKLAARQALLQEAPEYSLQLLDDTVRMVAPRGKQHAMNAMSMLTDVFIQYLMPARRLKSFRQQPLGALASIAASGPEARKRQLILWLFEDKLKSVYAAFVDKVREMAHDTVAKTRKHAISTMARLLTALPEMEQSLLESLVNKLGDEKKPVCTLTVKCLASLLKRHPAMRAVVIKEVERILFRRNVGKRVQFYGIVFLSQVKLSDQGDQDLVQRIVRIYISFFKACVKLAELDVRLMRALLAGLSSCLASRQLPADQLQQYSAPLHHIVQLANFGTATQALQLMYQLTASSGQPQPTDRFYSALYRKLVHPGLATSQKLSDFLNLTYRAMKTDSCEPRLRAFIKRLLQVCLHQTPALACSILVLLSALFRLRPELSAVSPRVSDKSVWTADGEEDDEENPRDVPLSDEEGEEKEGEEEEGEEKGGGPGWTFLRPSEYRLSRYSPLHREPRWCRADLAHLSELAALCRHFHPSVALFSQRLSASQPAEYPGNPLTDFRLMNFLHRFCYKNPKRAARPGSALEDGEAARRLQVSSPNYALLPEAQVPHDEKFFHRYFQWRQQHGPPPSAGPPTQLTDQTGDVTDEAFDQFLAGFYGREAAAAAARQEADDDDQLDFITEMAGFADQEPQSDDEGDEEDEGDDLDDDDLDLGDEDLDDEELDDWDMSESPGSGKRKKAQISAKPAGKRPKPGGAGVFAAAERFSELLEDGADDGDVTQRTSKKQLQWEAAGSGRRREKGSAAHFRSRRKPPSGRNRKGRGGR